jgi:hypothetical protein
MPPADWKVHARMVAEGWAGKTLTQIVAELDCHPKTGRIHLARRCCRGDQRPGHASRSGAQTTPERTGAQPDAQPGETTASRTVRMANK